MQLNIYTTVGKKIEIDAHLIATKHDHVINNYGPKITES
jgi:hypothetical protein